LIGGGLLVAETRTAPAVIKTQSIAARAAFLPALPKLQTSSPKLTTVSPLLSGLKSKSPSSLGTATPSLHNAFFPIFDPICAALFAERDALLATPPSPAREANLAANAIALALFHCVPISGV